MVGDAGDPVRLGEADQWGSLVAPDRWRGPTFPPLTRTTSTFNPDLGATVRAPRRAFSARVALTGRVLLPHHDDMTGNEAGDARPPRVLGVAGASRACAADDRPVTRAGSADAAEPTMDAAIKVCERNRESEPGEHGDLPFRGRPAGPRSRGRRCRGRTRSRAAIRSGTAQADDINLACRHAQRTAHPDTSEHLVRVGCNAGARSDTRRSSRRRSEHRDRAEMPVDEIR